MVYCKKIFHFKIQTRRLLFKVFLLTVNHAVTASLDWAYSETVSMSGYFRLKSCAAVNKRATKQSREVPSSHFSPLKQASSCTFQPASAKTVTYLLSLSTSVSTDGTGVWRQKGFLKLLRTIFCPKTLAEMRGPIFPDLQYLLAWR